MIPSLPLRVLTRFQNTKKARLPLSLAAATAPFLKLQSRIPNLLA